MQTANAVDFAVLIVYVALMVIVGIFATRFNRGASEYFKGGGRIPWVVAGLSAFMSGFSTWTFTGAAGVAYNHGIAVVLLYLGSAASFLLGYFFFAARWRRTRNSTVMEYLSARFGPATHQLFSWATVIFQLFTSASTLYGLSVFISSACNVTPLLATLLCGVVILSYSVTGGLWAVVISEFLQASILVPFCIVLVGTTLLHAHGPLQLLRSLPPSMTHLPLHGEFGWFYVIAWTIMVSFGYNTSAQAQRYFSVEDEAAAKKVSLLCAGLFALGALLWFIPPIAMRVVYPDLHAIWPALKNPGEASYVLASLTYLPHGLIGIMLAAMFSATMSGLAANFNVKSAILSKDIYQKLLRPSATDRELHGIGIAMTLLVGGITVSLAAAMAKRGLSIFNVMLTFNTLLLLSYGPPALLGLAFRRAPRWSGVASFLTGLVLGLLGNFSFQWDFNHQIFFIVPCSFAVFFLAMLFPEVESPEKAELFLRLNTPVSKAELEHVPDFSQPVFLFLSRSVAAIGLLSLLLLLPLHGSHWQSVLAFSAMTLCAAAALRVLCVRPLQHGESPAVAAASSQPIGE